MINVSDSGQIPARDTNIGSDSIISSFGSCEIDINLFLISTWGSVISGARPFDVIRGWQVGGDIMIANK